MDETRNPGTPTSCSLLIDSEGNIRAWDANAFPTVDAGDGLKAGMALSQLLKPWASDGPPLPDPLLPVSGVPSGFPARIGSCPVRVTVTRLEPVSDLGYICHLQRIPDIPVSTPLGQILQEPDGISRMYLRLQRAESRLESYMRHFPGVFFTQRTDLSFDYISPSFEKLLEFPIQRLLKSGSQFLSLIYEKDRDFFVRELRKHASNRSSFTLQYRVRRPKDGSVAYLTDVRSPVYSESGILLGYEGVWLDTTRQIIAERKLTSSAWKESLAMLTAGLVHDFSNVMAGIYALSELYHASMDPEDRMYEGLGQIKKSSMEARHLVRRIIDLNREVSGQKSYHDPEKLIHDQVDLLRVIFPKGTHIQLELTGTEIPVYIDDVEFRQVLLNLAMNAKDALDKTGIITIRSRRVQTEDRILEGCQQPARRSSRPGIEIIFEDNGSGIPPAHRNRIFQSFFTTKEIHKGSGFGLYNVQRIIRSFNGEIDFSSEEGHGTAFHIFIPEADFTEDHMGMPELPALSNAEEEHRPLIIVVSDTDVSQFDLIDQLRSHKWEVIVLDGADRLRRYLPECPKNPRLVVIIGPDDPVSIPDICGAVHSRYAGVPLALIPLGKNPDDLPIDSVNSVSVVLDPSAHPSSLMQELEDLVWSGEKNAS